MRQAICPPGPAGGAAEKLAAYDKGTTGAARADRPRSTWFALAALSLAMLLSSLGTSIANVALPTFARDFSASFQQVQWVVLIYLLASTISIVSLGRLGDGIGRRRLLIAGLILFTGASISCAAASSLPALIAARAAQGLGAAIMLALAAALTGEVAPKAKIGSAMGLLGTMSAAGTALGPSLGGLLIAGFGWRSIFLINLPLGAVAVILAWRNLPVDAPARKPDRVEFDAWGTLLLAFALGCYALAMTLGRGHFGMLNAALLVSAAIGGATFLLVEARAAAPLVDPHMVRDPILGPALAANLLVSTVMMASLVVGPFYLSSALGLGTAQAGAILSLGPLSAAIAGIPAGRSVDRFGPGPTIVAGLGAMAAGAALLAAVRGSAGLFLYIPAIIVLTAGYALFQAANSAAVMTEASPERRGVASALLSLSRNLGLITGASAMGAIFAFACGTEAVATAQPGAVVLGMRSTFGVAELLTLLALAIVLASRALWAPARE